MDRLVDFARGPEDSNANGLAAHNLDIDILGVASEFLAEGQPQLRLELDLVGFAGCLRPNRLSGQVNRDGKKSFYAAGRFLNALALGVILDPADQVSVASGHVGIDGKGCRGV